MTDLLFQDCHICGTRISTTRVEDGKRMTPSAVIRWYEKAINHIRREHSKKR